MTKINKNVNVNSTGLTSNIKKSESNKEEKLKRISEDKLAIKVRQAITRQKAILREIKDSQPVRKLGMKNNLSDPSNGLKKIPKPLPDLPHSGLNLKVREKKPLPPVPNKPQQQTLTKPASILITTSDVGLVAKQMESFKSAMNSKFANQAELLAKDLNKYAPQKNITVEICRKFAMNVERINGYRSNPTLETKQALVQFASAWIAMKSAQGDVKGSAWDVVINTLALSVQKKSKEWGMEF